MREAVALGAVHRNAGWCVKVISEKYGLQQHIIRLMAVPSVEESLWRGVLWLWSENVKFRLHSQIRIME